MPHYSKANNLLLEGAHFEITVFPPLAILNQHIAAKTQPPMTKAIALIDTGATTSCIDEVLIARKLNLIARDKTRVGNAGGGSDQFLYDAGFSIPVQSQRIIPLQVIGVNLLGQPYQALIGRDLLRFCNFIYCGANNFWAISI